MTSTIVNIVTDINNLDNIIDLKKLTFNDYEKTNILQSESKCEYVDDEYGDIIHSGNLYDINGKKYCFNCLVYHYVKLRKLNYQ